MKTINRDKIQRMIGNVGGNGGNGSSSADLAGYATQMWVEQNYISKAFFNTLFTIHGHDADDTNVPPTDVIIEPNDTETVLDSIEAMVGLWTEKYLSALGLSSGGGGGGDVLAEPLVSINGIGSPTAANQTLVWNGTQWTFQPYGQGGGSVTSIRITVPTGFAVSPSTITTAGTFAITFASGYSLPTTAKQTNWDNAYTWVNTNGQTVLTNSHSHSNKTVLDGISSTKVSNWDTAYTWVNANGASTVIKTAWGRTYWNAGAPANIDGDIENAANIKIDNNKKVSWKKSGASNYLSMLTLDASNNFVIGESMANEGLATYVRGRSINFQTGTGSSGNHAASMSDAGLFTVEKLRIGSIVISEDTQNGSLHVESAGLYADNYISALGANSSSGGGVGDVTWSALASSSDTRQIAASHLDVLSNYVTRGTAQSISGSKIFTSDLRIANIQPLTNNQFTVGTSDYRFMGCYFRDGDLSGNLTVSGRVGINGTNSSYRLYVNGSACVSRLVVNNTHGFEINWNEDGYYEIGSLVGSTEIHTNGLWYGSWRGASDIRKKNVVEHLNVSIEQIAKMPVFNFTWKDGKQGTYLGTSAQEVQKIFPAAVSTMKDGYLAMDYGATALAAAVMTARKVVDHEARIKQLENEIELLKAMQA